MGIKARRIVVLALSVFFLIVSPYLIFYGLGYKYNFQKGQLERTGVFYIKSFPKGAQVNIDGQKYRQETPTRLTRLLPKVYKVEISKPAYRSWQKNLPILPQLTTFIEDVSLFYEQLKPEKIISGNFTDLLPSHDQETLALVESTESTQSVWLYHLTSDSLTKIYETTGLSDLKLAEWSFSDKKLLVENQGNYLVVSAETPDVYFNLQAIAKVPLKEVKFSDANDNLLYGLNNSQLERIDLLNKSLTMVEKGKVLSYLPLGSQLAVILKEGDNYYLKIYENELSRILFSLPYSANYQFQKTNGKDLILFDQGQRQLYLVDPNDQNQPLKSVLANLDGFQWHDQQILYWNQSELWVDYPLSNEEILLERNSQGVENGFWHPNAAYIYGTVGNRLKLYELDSRDQRNVYDLLDIEAGKEKLMATNKKGDYLYLITSFEDTSGFYKIKIQ